MPSDAARRGHNLGTTPTHADPSAPTQPRLRARLACGRQPAPASRIRAFGGVSSQGATVPDRHGPVEQSGSASPWHLPFRAPQAYLGPKWVQAWTHGDPRTPTMASLTERLSKAGDISSTVRWREAGSVAATPDLPPLEGSRGVATQSGGHRGGPASGPTTRHLDPGAASHPRPGVAPVHRTSHGRGRPVHDRQAPVGLPDVDQVGARPPLPSRGDRRHRHAAPQHQRADRRRAGSARGRHRTEASTAGGLLLHLGARPHEALSLRVRDLDDGYVTLTSKKKQARGRTGRRRLPLPASLRRDLGTRAANASADELVSGVNDRSVVSISFGTARAATFYILDHDPGEVVIAVGDGVLGRLHDGICVEPGGSAGGPVAVEAGATGSGVRWAGTQSWKVPWQSGWADAGHLAGAHPAP